MRVVHLGFSDLLPGACSLSHRMHTGLREASVDSHMLVARKLSDDPSVHGPEGGPGRLKAELANRLEWYAQRALMPHGGEVTLGLFGSGALDALEGLQPDIVHAHWLGGGLVRPGGLRKLAPFPTVLTMHDMWPVAGVRHYEPVVGEESPPDAPRPWGNPVTRMLDRRSRRIKRRTWATIPNLTIHCYSSWIRDVAQSSTVFAGRDVELVRIGIDLQTFSPGDQSDARRKLGLPDEPIIVSFGAVRSTSNPRKGFALLRHALSDLAAGWSGPPLLLTVFGADEGDIDLPLPAHFLGPLRTETDMALLYRAADVFVAPSTQEVLGQTIVEALACGTPVVGFAIGGLRDAVAPESGYLAQPYDTRELARGIKQLATTARSPHCAAARAAARKRAELLYSRAGQTHELIDLYRRVLTRSRQVVR